MRESVQKKRMNYAAKARRRRVRRVIYPILGLALVCVLGWLLWLNNETNQQIAATEQRMARQAKKQSVLIARLNKERKAREASENTAIRDLIYRRTAEQQLETPPTLDGAKCNYLQTHNDPSQPDVLVNKSHCLTPLGFEPMTVVYQNARLQPVAADAYRQMQSAMQQTGLQLTATSTYRSYADQAATYRYWLTQEPRAEVDLVSAYPGYSEHQTGLVADVASGACALHCFGDTPEYAWMQAHAYEYGFIERYPAGKEAVTGYVHEPWHWRYIGVEDAGAMHTRAISTLETYWNID